MIEVILAVAIFAMFAAAISTYALGGLVGEQSGLDHVEAELLAQQGVEAVRSIRDRAWNEIIYNQSAIRNTGNQWFFTGEGSTESIGKFTRTITFAAICRDASRNIAACPGAYTDLNSKQVTAAVSWQPRLGITNTVRQSTYLTNWSGRDWTQTDWSGGSGQGVWSDPAKFNSGDSGIDVSVAPGELHLAQVSDGTWIVHGSETFDTTDEHFTQGSFINTQVSGGSVILIDNSLPGQFFSRIHDGLNQPTNWRTVVWTETLPAGADITITTRTGTTPTPDASWSAFGSEVTDPLGSNITVASRRYLQYRVTFTPATDPLLSPQLFDLILITQRASARQLNAMEVLAEDNAWAVGGNGETEQFDGSTWNAIDSPAVNTMNDMDMRTASDGWIAGNNGKIWHYDGVSWSEYVDTGNDTWVAIQMSSASDGWVVSSSAAISHYSGTIWSPVTAPSGVSTLNTVFVLSPADAWAAGGNGKIIHWNGESWSVYATTSGNETWNSLVMITEQEGWVVGSSGKSHHYLDSSSDGIANGTWSAVTTPTTQNLNSVAMVNEASGWAVGNDGVILRWNGLNWSIKTTPTDLNMKSVKMLSPQHGWAVGDKGMILEFISNTGYVASGMLVSSAFDTGANSNLNTIEWDQTLPSCVPICTVRFQVRAAPDNGGVPGAWTGWYGATGLNTYFTLSTGTLIPSELNDKRWVQYRVYLNSSIGNMPVVQEVRINYKNK